MAAAAADVVGGGGKWAHTYLNGRARSGAVHRPNHDQLQHKYRSNAPKYTQIRSTSPDYLRSRSRSSACPHSSASHSDATNEWKCSAKSATQTSATKSIPIVNTSIAVPGHTRHCADSPWSSSSRVGAISTKAFAAAAATPASLSPERMGSHMKCGVPSDNEKQGAAPWQYGEGWVPWLWRAGVQRVT